MIVRRAAVLAVVTLAACLSACGEPSRGARSPGGPAGPIGATVSAPVGAPSASPAGAGNPPAATAASRSHNSITDLATPFTCPQPTVTVLDGDELRAALKAAGPGDVIGLERGTYSGNFSITRSGTDQRPIFLCGPSNAVLDSRNQLSGYTLHLNGVKHWRLEGFSIKSGQKGVMLDACSSVVLQGLHVSETGDEAVHLRKASSGNVLQQLVIRKTGLLHPQFGEGIYVGSAKSNWCDVTGCSPDRSDGNLLLNNRISLTSAESVDIKEGTSRGVLSGNTFDGDGMVTTAADSWVDVKGNGWTISRNSGRNSPRHGFQVHVILEGWGDGNVFNGNISRLTADAGVGVQVEKSRTTRVHCDNIATGGSQPFNVPCTD